MDAYKALTLVSKSWWLIGILCAETFVPFYISKHKCMWQTNLYIEIQIKYAVQFLTWIRLEGDLLECRESRSLNSLMLTPCYRRNNWRSPSIKPLTLCIACQWKMDFMSVNIKIKWFLLNYDLTMSWIVSQTRIKLFIHCTT